MENKEDRARFMMSAARKEWHDPETVLRNIGIEKGMTLADLGSGPGFFTIPMAQATGENGTVYAVDSDPTMLKHLQENIAESGIEKHIFKVVNADVCNTGLPEKSVDVAFFANVLHEVKNKKAFLQEVNRICKPTAYVVDIDWKKIQTERGPPLKERLSEEEATNLLLKNGFEVIKQTDAGPKHYELICKLTMKPNRDALWRVENQISPNTKKEKPKQKVSKLVSLVNYEPESMASTTIIEKKAGSVAVFAFDKFQGVVQHILPYDTLFYVLEGEAQVTVNSKSTEVKEGEMTIFPANRPHAIRAKSRSKALLITLKE